LRVLKGSILQAKRSGRDDPLWARATDASLLGQLGVDRILPEAVWHGAALFPIEIGRVQVLRSASTGTKKPDGLRAVSLGSGG
jgi:hypothetical protein